MRMAFGLVGMLVTLGAVILIISHFYLPHTEEVLRQNRKVGEQVRQMAGVDENGLKTTESVTLAPDMSGSKLDNILVTSIVAGGPMEKYFGLKKDDCIIEANGLTLRGMNDPEMAKAMVFESYQRKLPLTVLRGSEGQKLTLPETAAPGAAKPKRTGDPLQNQLDALQGMPTH